MPARLSNVLGGGVQMAGLLWLALALVALWLILELVVGVAGFAVHLLLFAAAIALIGWAIRRNTSARTTTRTPV
jgi:hypothetical protein